MSRASGSVEWLDAHLVHFCLAREIIEWWVLGKFAFENNLLIQ